MLELTNNEGQLKASQILKGDAKLDLVKIDGSDAEFYNTVRDQAKLQQNEMLKFNELDEDQLRFVVQL